MNCDSIERDSIIERYLAGTLDAETQEEWELHYFACDRCAEQLETWRAIEKPLRSMEREIRAGMPGRASRVWWWAAAGAAAAAVAIVVLRVAVPASVAVKLPPAAAPQTHWAELARLDPPAYTAPVERGIESRAGRQFRQAMRRYQSGDYAAAIPELRAAVAADGSAPAPRFFLGACELLAGDAAAAVRQLDAVAGGDSPFADEAAFVLAKGYLKVQRADEALQTLDRLAARGGDFSEPARDLARRIRASAQGPR